MKCLTDDTMANTPNNSMAQASNDSMADSSNKAMSDSSNHTMSDSVANSNGLCEDGSQAIGCGRQEHFRACSDIRITEEGELPGTEEPTASSTSDPEKPTSTPGEDLPCKATGEYAGSEEIDKWCNTNCLHPTFPFCPPTHCVCN